MDKNALKEYWGEITTQLKQHWNKFAEHDLVKMKASYQELKQELQKKCAEKKEAAEKESGEVKHKKLEQEKKNTQRKRHPKDKD